LVKSRCTAFRFGLLCGRSTCFCLCFYVVHMPSRREKHSRKAVLESEVCTTALGQTPYVSTIITFVSQCSNTPSQALEPRLPLFGAKYVWTGSTNPDREAPLCTTNPALVGSVSDITASFAYHQLFVGPSVAGTCNWESLRIPNSQRYNSNCNCKSR
jgi:hypothetical protein